MPQLKGPESKLTQVPTFKGEEAQRQETKEPGTQMLNELQALISWYLELFSCEWITLTLLCLFHQESAHWKVPIDHSQHVKIFILFKKQIFVHKSVHQKY